MIKTVKKQEDRPCEWSRWSAERELFSHPPLWEHWGHQGVNFTHDITVYNYTQNHQRYCYAIVVTEIDHQSSYFTESCMVLQTWSRALRMTGSRVGSCWCLNTEQKKTWANRRPYNPHVSSRSLSHVPSSDHFLVKTQTADLLDKDVHDGFTHIHPHTVFLEHVQEG